MATKTTAPKSAVKPAAKPATEVKAPAAETKPRKQYNRRTDADKAKADLDTAMFKFGRADKKRAKAAEAFKAVEARYQAAKAAFEAVQADADKYAAEVKFRTANPHLSDEARAEALAAIEPKTETPAELLDLDYEGTEADLDEIAARDSMIDSQL